MAKFRYVENTVTNQNTTDVEITANQYPMPFSSENFVTSYTT